MTSKLVVNTIEADTGISSVSFASSISMSSTSVFHFSDAGVNIGADTNISRLGNGILGFKINDAEKFRIDSSGHIKAVGVCTATHFYGDGSNLTGISAGTSLSGSTNNTVCTVTGANAIQGEAGLTYDGSALIVRGSDAVTGSGGTKTIDLRGGDANNEFVNLSFATGAGGPLAVISAKADATGVYPNTSGSLTFNTQVGGGIFERLRINTTGNMSLGGLEPVPTSSSYNTASFHIHQTTNATNVGAQVHLTTANKGSAAGDGAQISQYNGNLYINNQDDGNMYFLNNSNSTIRMTITSAGALGFAGANYGTAGQVLKSGGSGAAPTWGSAGGHTETYARAVFGSVYDTNSGYIVHNITSGSSNGITIDTTNERLTPTVSGTYLIIYNAHWLGLHSSGTTYYNRITKNGSEIISSNFSAYDPGSHMHTVMTTASMNGSSDYIQFEFYENKSGAAAYVSHKSRAVMILLDT